MKARNGNRKIAGTQQRHVCVTQQVFLFLGVSFTCIGHCVGLSSIMHPQPGSHPQAKHVNKLFLQPKDFAAKNPSSQHTQQPTDTTKSKPHKQRTPQTTNRPYNGICKQWTMERTDSGNTIHRVMPQPCIQDLLTLQTLASFGILIQRRQRQREEWPINSGDMVLLPSHLTCLNYSIHIFVDIT